MARPPVVRAAHRSHRNGPRRQRPEAPVVPVGDRLLMEPGPSARRVGPSSSQRVVGAFHQRIDFRHRRRRIGRGDARGPGTCRHRAGPGLSDRMVGRENAPDEGLVGPSSSRCSGNVGAPRGGFARGPAYLIMLLACLSALARQLDRNAGFWPRKGQRRQAFVSAIFHEIKGLIRRPRLDTSAFTTCALSRPTRPGGGPGSERRRCPVAAPASRRSRSAPSSGG